MRVREVKLVRQVLDVDLDAEIVGDIVIGSGIDTSVAREHRAIAIVDVAAVLMRQSQTESELISHLQIVPEREHVLRQFSGTQTRRP